MTQDLTPKDLPFATGNRDSIVHSSDAETVGILSKGHSEADISRTQPATNPFNNLFIYKEFDLVLQGGVTFRAVADNGPSAFTPADWKSIEVVQDLFNDTLIADQTIAIAGDQDITGLTTTLSNSPGKHANIVFNVNFEPGSSDRDLSFGVSDDGVITNRYAQYGGKNNTVTSVSIPYWTELLGQVVKLTVDIQGGLQNNNDIRIFGLSVPASSIQVIEFA